MKHDAKLRILIWSIVIVLLLSLMFASIAIHKSRGSRPTDTATLPLESLEIIHKEPASSTSAALAEDAALYNSPSMASDRSSTLDKDTVVTVIRQESINGEIWVYLSTDTDTGWLPQSMLLFAGTAVSDPQASDPGTASEPETVATDPTSP